MSADKYPSIFSRQMATIVYICSTVQYVYMVHVTTSLIGFSQWGVWFVLSGLDFVVQLSGVKGKKESIRLIN